MLGGTQPLAPSGRVGFKLGPNCVAGFPAQRIVAALGYQQMPWVLGETIAEASAMNLFAMFERPTAVSVTLLSSLSICSHSTFGVRTCSFVPRCAHRTRRGHTSA